MTDDSRQEPRRAVLGVETATSERGRERRRTGGEPNITMQHLHESEANARPVDSSDERLRESRPVRHPTPASRRPTNSPRGRLLQLDAVETGAKTPTCTGKHDRAHIG